MFGDFDLATFSIPIAWIERLLRLQNTFYISYRLPVTLQGFHRSIVMNPTGNDIGSTALCRVFSLRPIRLLLGTNGKHSVIRQWQQRLVIWRMAGDSLVVARIVAEVWGRRVAFAALSGRSPYILLLLAMLVRSIAWLFYYIVISYYIVIRVFCTIKCQEACLIPIESKSNCAVYTSQNAFGV